MQLENDQFKPDNCINNCENYINFPYHTFSNQDRSRSLHNTRKKQTIKGKEIVKKIRTLSISENEWKTLEKDYNTKRDKKEKENSEKAEP
uniref:Uncharacterized protein n=1 Tax=Romanomermis culicivorax TaxID=13658 RepID=A0A915HZ30_ROMCU